MKKKKQKSHLAKRNKEKKNQTQRDKKNKQERAFCFFSTNAELSLLSARASRHCACLDRNGEAGTMRYREERERERMEDEKEEEGSKAS